MAKWDLSKLPQGRKPLDEDWFAKQLHPSPEAIVRAALERAVKCCEDELRNTAMLLSNPPKSSAAWDAANSIRKLADDTAEVTAIIKKAGRIGDE